MSVLPLAWRLVRAGARFRAGAIVAGNAIGTTVFLLALSIPAAIRPPGAPVDREERLLVLGVVVFLCLPVTALLLSIGRLSASTRDRRLAALRMLGLTPGRTRLVAALENGLLAAVGGGLGLAGYLLAAPLVEAWVAAGPAWFLRPLRLSGAGIGAICAGLVLLSMTVSLAPTRSLHRQSMQLRRDGATVRPSRWRLVPLALGLVTLGYSLQHPSPAQQPGVDQDRLGLIILIGVALTGLGLAVALPLAVRGVATLAAGPIGGVTVRLAGARLACEPAGTVRVVSGLAVAAFLVTGSIGVLAAVQHTPEYLTARHAYQEGPQEHRLWVPPDGPELSSAQLRRVAATPGVQAVIPDHGLGAGGCATPHPGDFCGLVFVGTCEHLNQLWVVPGCDDATVSLIDSPVARNGTDGLPVVPDEIELVNPAGDTATVAPAGQVLAADDRATRARFPGYDPVSLFVPADLPQIAAVIDRPDSYRVLTGPGQPPRDALQAAVADLPVQLNLEYLEPYRNVQRVQVLVWTLSAVVIGIGLLSMLLTAVDRALERRRQIASQVAVGVPLRVLRSSQLLQVLVPLWLALIAAVALGFLPLVAFLRLVTTVGAAPLATVASMTVGTLTAAAVVAVTTLGGIGGRLTPDLLRRE